MNNALEDKIKLLPSLPGVYKMFDKTGTIIYVGKAKNLKNRVRQYFYDSTAEGKNGIKVQAMVSHIFDFEYVITGSETEAFTLEANLIKQYMPHYNILLKDDKHFPYLAIDLAADYPAITVTRRLQNDGRRYFGPYLSAQSLSDALTAIREYFPVRHCKKDIKKAQARRERPCLMYHIGKCVAPCSGKVTPNEYHALIQNIISFLCGDSTKIVAALKERMQIYAAEMDYENAAVMRDRIAAIEALSEKQRASASKKNMCDVFAAYSNEGDTMVYALFVRDGNIIGTQGYMLEKRDEAPSEIVTDVIKQLYTVPDIIPKEILVYSEISEKEELSAYLSELCGHSVSISVPQRGDKRALAQMAFDNAEAELTRRRDLARRSFERGEGAVAELSCAIGMDFVPSRIECYDNSHIMGRDTVGAMIVFENGAPAKAQYRRFKIKADAGGDDYLAMQEVLTRRLQRAMDGDEKFSRLPDLIIADGGRGQLNVVLSVLEQFGLSHIAAVGLAEKNEEIVLPDSNENLILERHGAAQHLIERIRDEAHRFAITYHRSLRTKSALYSVLDGIDGIGEKRKRALFDKFLTLEQIKAASTEELSHVPGMTKPAAAKVYSFFHANDHESRESIENPDSRENP